MKTKICSKCNEKKSVKEFGKRNASKDGFVFRCRKYLLEYNQQYRQRPGVIARMKASAKKCYWLLKFKALRKVGKLECELCGCTKIYDLTVDHFRRDGSEHRMKLFKQFWFSGLDMPTSLIQTGMLNN